MTDRETNSCGKLLIVGLACVDIVNVAAVYPTEDTDQKLLDQQVNRGGNATNTSVVLSQLGSPVEWLGTLATDNLAETLPELDPKDFEKLDFGKYSWIHFEGRNQVSVEKMISMIDDCNERRKDSKPITVSVEAEKTRNITHSFLQKAEFVFISKDYSMAMGYNSAEECLNGVREKKLLKTGAKAICAWGEKGAWGLEESGRIVHSPTYPPIKVVDTLGAGDTFNAGVLHALNRGRTLEEALRLGCQVAGQKVGRSGFKIDTASLDLL